MPLPHLRHAPQRIACFLIALVATGLTGCIGSQETARTEPLDAEQLEALYTSAVADAAMASPVEISSELTPIAPYVQSLIRRRAPGDSAGREPRHVRVATWTSHLDTVARGDSLQTTWGDTWVTVAPEMQTFCQALNLRGDALDVRLAQRLGLPPDTRHEHFVEYWVRPANLFRPCPDPEITDQDCELSRPRPASRVQVSAEHTAWMDSVHAASYGDNGYPWTRLGYTYDWNPATPETGPSEYVIPQGSTVEVHANVETTEYCIGD